jgi:hypothetical protein
MSKNRDSKWDHDKYVASRFAPRYVYCPMHFILVSSLIYQLIDLFNSPERVIPKDYRPPSPQWISRAGGVAIMKKR